MADQVLFVQYHDPSRTWDVVQKRDARSSLSRRPRAHWGTSTRSRLTKGRKANATDKKVVAKLIHDPRPKLNVREVGSNLSDFENVLPVKPNSYTTAISAFIIQGYSQSRLPVQRASGIQAQFTTLLWRHGLQHPVLFHAYVFLGILNYHGYNSTTSLNAPPPPQVLYHVDQSIRLLRSHIEENKLDMALEITIASLQNFSLAFGDIEAVQAHNRALQAIRAAKAGPQEIVAKLPKVNSHWYLPPGADFFTVQPRRDGNDEPFDPPAYPKHPFSPELCAQLTLFPSSLSDLILTGKFSLPFIEMCTRIVKMHNILDRLRQQSAAGLPPPHAPSSQPPSPGSPSSSAASSISPQEMGSILTYQPLTEFEEGSALLQRLSAHRSALHGTEAKTLEEAFTLALITFQNYAWNRCRFGPLYETLRCNLADSLRSCQYKTVRKGSHTERQALIWMLMICIVAFDSRLGTLDRGLDVFREVRTSFAHDPRRKSPNPRPASSGLAAAGGSEGVVASSRPQPRKASDEARTAAAAADEVAAFEDWPAIARSLRRFFLPHENAESWGRMWRDCVRRTDMDVAELPAQERPRVMTVRTHHHHPGRASEDAGEDNHADSEVSGTKTRTWFYDARSGTDSYI